MVGVFEHTECPCEWRPLKCLLTFAHDILHRQCYGIYSSVEDVKRLDNSFSHTIEDIKGVLRCEYDIGLSGLAIGFSFTLLCTRPNELLQNLPSVLSISNDLLEVPFSVLSSIFFIEPTYLTAVSKLWPEMFFAALNNVIHCKEKGENLSKVDIDSVDAASVAFSRYLNCAPFYVLFSCIAQSSSLHLFEQSTLQKLLLDKVNGISSDYLLSSLCNVLFWINHTRSYCELRSCNELDMLSEICFILAEHMLKQLLVDNIYSGGPALINEPRPLHSAVDVAEIIFNCPAVSASLNCPLSGHKMFSNLVFEENLEKLLDLAKEGIHRMDLHVLNLLRTVCELLFPMCDVKISEQMIVDKNLISRAFKLLKQKLFLTFKNKFEACVQSMDFKPLVPIFYALHSLLCFLPPFELLELVNWLFSRVDVNDPTFLIPSNRNALFVGLHFASCTFDSLSSYLRKPHMECQKFSLLDETEAHFDVSQFERIFIQILEIGCHMKLDVADACLLKAVKVVKLQKSIYHTHLPFVLVLQRVITTIPVSKFSYFLNRINRTKAELLYLITGMSPQHMSVYGFIFSQLMDKSFFLNANGTQETCQYSFSDEELLLLLPCVILYLNSAVSKFGGLQYKPFASILSVYGRLLLEGFSEWKVFVCGIIFEIESDEPFTSSKEKYLNLFLDSLLGKAIVIVWDFLVFSDDKMKVHKGLSLFNSICPSCSDDIFDYCCGETGIHSVKRPFDFVNRAVAKINFCRKLLFSDYNPSNPQLNDPDRNVDPSQVTSDMAESRIRFLRVLINSWIMIVKKFAESTDYSGNVDGEKHPFRFLEVFVMNNILELTSEMRDCLIKLKSLPFIEQLVKSFLLYRFGDPATLRMLRNVLTILSHGKFSCVSVIQLLLSHSQFAQRLHLACQPFVPSKFGLVFTPMQSILRSFLIPRTNPDNLCCKNNKSSDLEHQYLLELVKFIRVLFSIYTQQREVNSGVDSGINSRELLYLLLSSYGATCSEVDFEIYNLMLEIESNDESCAGTVVQTDYLWGFASLKARKDREQGKDMQCIEGKNIDECRKVFRENIPIDPKLCAQTVLYFPYNRFVSLGSLHNLEKASSIVMQEVPSTTDKLQIYDPVFIIRFSIYCLSMIYIEPIEFVSLGLLSIAFVSLSSPDDDLRKLGYEALAKFKGALEIVKRKKNVVRLQLLLSYLQNGIEEPWQRIPSIIALFFAEASLVLLDPSHDNYSTICKCISNSPEVNMKGIPLFKNFFWSNSISFNADRLWMLRLLCVGLNSEDDAQIYIRNSIFETLMNFYYSPLSDNSSKELIMQVMKKAVLLHKAVWFLVAHCGFILWLSSIISFLCGSEILDERKLALSQLPEILEVVNCVTAPRNIVEWLQKHAMEQLSELSLHLFKLLVDDVELIKDQSSLCALILKVLTLVLKISQKRKLYQPHFTMSKEDLFKLYEAVEMCSQTHCKPITGLGLKAVLMTTPPVSILHVEQQKLLNFLRWTVSTAVQSKSEDLPEDSDHHIIAGSAKNPLEESLVSKLFRWLTASVILGKISCKSNDLKDDGISERPTLGTLQSLLRYPETKEIEESAGYGCENILAASIFYLIQLLDFSHELLPSAVSAICLLLLSESSELENLVGPGTSLSPLCSKIHCPAEANPSWRWSYHQPWRDLTIQQSDIEKLEEIQACETLLTVASNILLQKNGCSHFFQLKDVDNLDLRQWEQSLLQSE